MSEEIDVFFITHYKVNKETKDTKFIEGICDVDNDRTIAQKSGQHWNNYNEVCERLGLLNSDMRREVFEN